MGFSAHRRVQERGLPGGEGEICVHSFIRSFIQTQGCRLFASSDALAVKEGTTSTVSAAQPGQDSEGRTPRAAGAQEAPDSAWGRAGCAEKESRGR